MVESWVIGIMLRATSNLAGVMTASARSTIASNKALETQNKLLAQQRALRARAMVYGGIAGALTLGMGEGVKQAAGLQQAMVGVQIATSATHNQMQALSAMAVRMSGVTAQSMLTMGQEMKTAATGGLTSVKQLLSTFPLIAKAADVLWISHGTNPVEAVKQLTQLTHLYGHYQGKAFSDMINSATKLMFVQPEGLQAVVNQSRLFVPIARTAGISQQDIFGLTSAMGLTGFLKGRGGSGAARTIEYLLGAASIFGLSGKQHQALGAHGLNLLDASGRLRVQFEDKRGNLLYDKVIAYLESERKLFKPADFAMMLHNAFLQQGGLFTSALLMPSTYAKFQQTQAHMAHMANVEGMWRQYSNTVSFAVPQFLTNLKNVLAAIFLPTLPTITAALKVASGELGKWTNFLMKRPKVAFGIATAAFGATIITATMAARAVWQLNASLGGLAAVSRGGGVGRFLPGFGGVAAGGGMVSLLGAAGLLAGSVLAIGGLAYGAQQLARNWQPLNNLIAGTVIDLERLPGPFHNLGVSLEAIARKVGILTPKSAIGYRYTAPGDPRKTAKSLGISLAGEHLSVQAHQGWWTTNVWKPLGQRLKDSLTSDRANPGSTVLQSQMRQGIETWIGNWWSEFNSQTPIITDAQRAHLDRLYQLHGDQGGKPSVHIGQIVVPPHTDPKDLKKIAGYVLGSILEGAKGASDTTGIHFPIVPHHPASAFGST